MKRPSILFCTCLLLAAAQAQEGSTASGNGASVRDGWVTVTPTEFTNAINNPLKGFRAYKKDGYGLVVRTYIKWNDIEVPGTPGQSVVFELADGWRKAAKETAIPVTSSARPCRSPPPCGRLCRPSKWTA